MQPGARIGLEKVSRLYGTQRALDALDLAIEPGEWIAVMGPSGSGKTTLLNLLGGLDRPDEGSITVDGLELARLDETARTRYRREKVGLVFQQFHLLPYLTTVENVMVAQHYHSMADEAEAKAALVAVGLGEKLNARPGQLSGGEEQRVCIARALINRPRLLLADEPTGNLDETNARIVLELLARLHREGHTIVLVTHDPAVGALADRRVELHHGRLAAPRVADAPHTERCDHFLEEMWYLWEDGRPLALSSVRAPKVVDRERTAREVVDRRLVVLSGDELAFTARGAVRAHDLVRRRRLAECLFVTALAAEHPPVDATACGSGNILDPQATERICAFLKHPADCPHGKPVPAGACCPPERRRDGPPANGGQADDATGASAEGVRTPA